jgi:hypothetical protein
MAEPRKKRSARKGEGKAEAGEVHLFELGPVMVWSFKAIDGSDELAFNEVRSLTNDDISTALAAILDAVTTTKKREQKKVMQMFEAAAAGARFVVVAKDGADYICQPDEQMLKKIEVVECDIAALRV